MSEFTLLSYQLRINCPTTMSDEEGEKIWQEIDDEVSLGIEAVKTNLKEKFSVITSVELVR